MKELSDYEKRIVAIVLESWIAGKDALTAEEIGEKTGTSAARVRKAMAARYGTIPGLAYSQGEKATYSRSYPGFQAGVVRVGTWRPSGETLRAEIVKLRALAVEARAPKVLVPCEEHIISFEEGCEACEAEVDAQEEDREGLALALDWRYEVANGDTRLGFVEWKAHKQEAEKGEVASS